MDQLETHIISLEQKIDRLYSVVEHLNQRVDEALDTDQTTDQTTHNHEPSPKERLVDDTSSQTHQGVSNMMEHKDVLMDDDIPSNNNVASDGEEVSPETQIRRLNTQLTAAYNRIAALEEQLLAQRVPF